MTAAELIAKLQLLPPDTVIALEDDNGIAHHVSRTTLAVVHDNGVAYIDPSPRVIEDAEA
jgi:hypothetical protein